MLSGVVVSELHMKQPLASPSQSGCSLSVACSQENRETATKLFWHFLDHSNAPDDAAGLPDSWESSLKGKPPRWPNIQNARVAVKLFLTLEMTVEEVGGLERVHSDFVAPLLLLSERNNQVCIPYYAAEQCSAPLGAKHLHQANLHKVCRILHNITV